MEGDMRTAGKRGTIIERKPGVFLVQVSHPAGHKVSKTIRYDARYKPGSIPREIQNELASLLLTVERDRSKRPTLTFTQAAKDWLEATDLAPSTRYSYERYLDREIKPVFGNRPVEHITARDIDDFHRATKDRLSPATQRQIHAIIRNVLKAAMKWGFVDVNVATMTGPTGGGAAATHEVKAPTPDEVARLMEAAAADPEFHTYLVLSAALGSRRGETTAVRWSSIDWEEGSVRIDGSIDNTPGTGRTLKATKTHANGTLSVGPKVMDVLRRYRELKLSEAAFRGCELDEHGFLFSNHPRGERPWDPGTATHKFAQAREKAGLGPHVKLKNLRHFHATQLLSAGVDVRTVAGRLRHASANTTYQFYAKFDETADRKASAIFDSVI